MRNMSQGCPQIHHLTQQNQRYKTLCLSFLLTSKIHRVTKIEQ